MTNLTISKLIFVFYKINNDKAFLNRNLPRLTKPINEFVLENTISTPNVFSLRRKD